MGRGETFPGGRGSEGKTAVFRRKTRENLRSGRRSVNEPQPGAAWDLKNTAGDPPFDGSPGKSTCVSSAGRNQRPARVIRRRHRASPAAAKPTAAIAYVEGSGTAVMLMAAGRLLPEFAQFRPASVEIFVTGLSGVQPLVFCVPGKSPLSLNDQLNSDEASGAETTTQYDEPVVRARFPKLKVWKEGATDDTVAVCVPSGLPNGTPPEF